MGDSNALMSPLEASQITEEWLAFVLSQYETRMSGQASVKVISFEINPGAKQGENFISEAVRLRVEGERRRHGDTQPSHVTYNIFAKFLLGNEYQREGAFLRQVNLRELLVFSDVVADLNAFQRERAGDRYRLHIPEYVYGVCENPECVLMMQDLSALGYVMEDKRRGLDLQHALMAVTSLAHLHAVSYAFNQTHNFLKKYPAYSVQSDMAIFMKIFIDALYGNLLKAINSSEHPLLHQTLTRNKEVLIHKVVMCLFPSDDDKIVTLCHGDFWTNNIMFKHGECATGEERRPDSLMFIDWGSVGWRNPLTDLQYLIHSSTLLEIRKTHLHELLHHYHTTFTAATADLGATLTNWDFEDLLAEWRRTEVMGTLFGVFLSIIALGNNTEMFIKGKLHKGLAYKFHTKVAKTLIPVMASRRMLPLFHMSMKHQIKPIFREVGSGRNEHLTARVMDLLTEAHANGAFEA